MLYILSLILLFGILFLMLYGVIKPALDWYFSKVDPFENREKIFFKDSIYHDLFCEQFRKICDKAAINYDDLKIYILKAENSPYLLVNAAAWQTIRTQNHVFIEEDAFLFFENNPKIINAIFAHEVGHLKYKDSLWKFLINEYGPILAVFLTLFSMLFFAFFLDNVIKAIPNDIIKVALTIIGLFFAIIQLSIFFVTFFTSWLIPTWIHQISEIRADIFSVKLTGKEHLDYLFQIFEENERYLLENSSLINRLIWGYRPSLHEHPATSFRRKQIKTIKKLTFSFRIRHYLRLLWWAITLRGFYGEYLIFKPRKSINS